MHGFTAGLVKQTVQSEQSGADAKTLWKLCSLGIPTHNAPAPITQTDTHSHSTMFFLTALSQHTSCLFHLSITHIIIVPNDTK